MLEAYMTLGMMFTAGIAIFQLCCAVSTIIEMSKKSSPYLVFMLFLHLFGAFCFAMAFVSMHGGI